MLVEHLETTRDAFVAAITGLTEAQAAFRTREGAWSIAEIAEHVALAERATLHVVTTKLPEGPPAASDKLTGAARFARLAGIIPTRQQRRLDAPEPLRPKGAWPSLAASLAAFVEAREQAIAAARAAGPDVAARVFAHRLLGELDREEWLYFIGLHSARHTAQVQEIRAAAGFPAA